jgi:GxxExxY protein
MATDALIERELTGAVIGAFYAVYNALGTGFLETVYLAALTAELRRRGHRVDREVMVPVYYRNQTVRSQRLDMLVDGRLVVEAKSARKLHYHATRQLYNYLRGTRLKVGLLLHFGPRPKFYRVVNLRT